MEQTMIMPPAPPGVVVSPTIQSAPAPSPAPIMESGGPVISTSFLKGINWVEVVVVVIFGVVSWQAISFFRFKIKTYKNEMNENSSDIKQIRAQLSALQQTRAESDAYNLL